MKQPKLKIGSKVKVIKTGKSGIIDHICPTNPNLEQEYEVGFGNIFTSVYIYKELELQLIPNTKSKYKYSRKKISEILKQKRYKNLSQSIMDMLMAKQDKTVKEEESKRIMMEQVREEIKIDITNSEISGICWIDGSEYNVDEKKLLEYIMNLISQTRQDCYKEIREMIELQQCDRYFEDNSGKGVIKRLLDQPNNQLKENK